MIGTLEDTAVTLKHVFDGQTFTVGYPEVAPEVNSRFRDVHKFSQERCIWCHQCGNICPDDTIQIIQDDQRSGEQYNLHIDQYVYCRLCGEVYSIDAVLLTQNSGFMANTRNDFIYNKEQSRNVPWYKNTDPLDSRNPDYNTWVDEDEGEVDYQ